MAKMHEKEKVMAKMQKKEEPRFEIILAEGYRNYLAERIDGYLWLLHDAPLDSYSAVWLLRDLKNDPDTYSLLKSGSVDIARLYQKAARYQRVLVDELSAGENALKLAMYEMGVPGKKFIPGPF